MHKSGKQNGEKKEKTPEIGIRSPRVAEIVAGRIRREILTGQLEDGELLPKEEILRKKYPASKPTFREAMRILEAEGLITIKRGNVGGSVVHIPTSSTVASTLAMVLSTRKAGIHDVARALQESEPACAAMCAERDDRHDAVIPILNEIQKESLDNVHDLVFSTIISRRFHEALVELCGNQTLIILVGALEEIWSSHETGWASNVSNPEEVTIQEREAAFGAHAQIISLIEEGNSTEVRRVVSEHLKTAQNYPQIEGSRTIDSTLLRPNYLQFL